MKLLKNIFKKASTEKDVSENNLEDEYVSTTVKVPDAQPVAETNGPTNDDNVIGNKTLILATDRSLFKSILSALYDAVLILDQKGYIIASNRRVETLFGYSEKDLWNIECHKLIQGFTPIALNKIRSELNNDRFCVLTGQCIKKCGTSFKAEIAISKICFLSEFDMLLSIRKLDNRELELEALSNTIAGLLICNEHGMIEYVNATMLRLLLLNRNDEIQGRSLKDFCVSQEIVDVILKTTSPAIRWNGTIGLKTNKNTVIECHATSVLSSTSSSSFNNKRLVITFIPVLKKATS